jgi:hypothetical protein
MPDENYSGRQRRSSFRLTYPSNQSPRIKINGVAYAIIDMSENGIRFYNPFHHRMPDDLFTAHVSFQDGEQIKVIARIIRYEPLMVALYLAQGVPYPRMLVEQAMIHKALKK